MNTVYGVKSKEYVGTCMDRPVFMWGMRFYKDPECKDLAFIDPFHYKNKDGVVKFGGVPTLVHVVKK